MPVSSFPFGSMNGEILTSALVSRLSNVALAQLQSLQDLLPNATLSDQPDSKQIVR